MSVNIEKLPKTYHGRTDWYVSDWTSGGIYCFGTKPEAVAKAKELWSGSPTHIVNVGWIPRDGRPLRELLSRTATIHDCRKV